MNDMEETFGDGTLSGRGPVDASGRKNGRWSFFYRSGGVKGTGDYLDGEMHGEWTWTREDGSLMRAGRFEAGAQRGEWRTYDREGALARTTDFH